MRASWQSCILGAAALPACGGTVGVGLADGGLDVTDGQTDVVGQDVPLSDGVVPPPPPDAFSDDGGSCGFMYGPGICGAALCGNGVRDTCQVCGGPGGGGPPGFDAGCTTTTEECDGTDLGGQTCQGLGYAGGSLICSGGCSFDPWVCLTCAPASNGAGCTTAPQAAGVGIAASSTEIGLAWIAVGGDCQGVRFNRYGTDLSLLSQSACLSSCDANAVAVASTPSGWVLAIEVQGGVEVIALDAQGVAPRMVPRLIPGAYAPILAARGLQGASTGGPLLMWATRPHGDAYAAVLAVDGSEEHPAAQVFSGTVEPHRGSAVFAGNGFFVAERAMVGRDTIGVVPIGLDGSVGAATTPAPGYAEYPQVAWTGTEGRLVYAQFSSANDGMYWTRLDPQGAPLGTAAFVGAYPMVYARSPTVALGDDTLTLIGDMGYLALVHVSSAGVVSAPVQIVTNSVAEQQMVLSGTSAFAGWLESSGSRSFVQDTPGGLVGRAAMAHVGP